MSIYFPSNLIISNVKITHYTPNFLNQSINLKVASYARDIHQIQGSFDVNITSDIDQRSYESFLMSIKGGYNPFYIFLHGRFASPTVISSNLPITSSFPVGATSVTLGTFMGTVSEGDVFYVINDPKVYMATNTVQSGGTLNFYPPLMKSIPLNQFCHFNNVPIFARMDNDKPTIQYTQAGLIHKTTIKFKESL